MGIVVVFFLELLGNFNVFSIFFSSLVYLRDLSISVLFSPPLELLAGEQVNRTIFIFQCTTATDRIEGNSGWH